MTENAILQGLTWATFVGFLVAAVACRPRNEWFSNTLVVLGATLLALWYQPVMPELFQPLHGPDGSLQITHPLHRLVGLPLLIAVAWALLLQWEDLKAWRRARKKGGEA